MNSALARSMWRDRSPSDTFRTRVALNGNKWLSVCADRCRLMSPRRSLSFCFSFSLYLTRSLKSRVLNRCQISQQSSIRSIAAHPDDGHHFCRLSSFPVILHYRKELCANLGSHFISHKDWDTDFSLFIFAVYSREKRIRAKSGNIVRFVIFLVKSKQMWAYFTDYDRLMEFRSLSLNAIVYNVKYWLSQTGGIESKWEVFI